MHITDELLGYLKLIPILEMLGKICCILGVALGVVMVFWYPQQQIWQKRLVHKIEINALEANGISADQAKSNGVEDPLLNGLQYAGAKEGD